MAMSSTTLADSKDPQDVILIKLVATCVYNMHTSLKSPIDSKIWYGEALRRMYSSPMEVESWRSHTVSRQLG